jgi:hypothetical protein
VPRLERLPQFHVHVASRDRAEWREAELQVRSEPFGPDWPARSSQIVQNVAEVLRDEVRQHEPIVKLGAPARERPIVRRRPERRDERAQE